MTSQSWISTAIDYVLLYLLINLCELAVDCKFSEACGIFLHSFILELTSLAKCEDFEVDVYVR